MQSLRRVLALVPAVAVVLAMLVAAPASAKDTGVCTLLTRAEATKLLGYKVVKTEKKTSKTTGAQECRYKTKKVGIKGRDLKVQLEVSVEPLTDELHAKLQRIPSNDGERVEGLGDEAYATNFDQVIAISGTTVVAAKLQNYQGASSKFRDVSEGAVRIALTRLDRVTVTPPSSPGS